VGELQKVDSAALKSRLFIFGRPDLGLTEPSSPKRLADSHGPPQPHTVGQIRWVSLDEQARVNSAERQGVATVVGVESDST
jgi:hypothetical protein